MENKDLFEPETICPRIVNENIIRVRTGQPLTKPLALLNKSCDFKKEWDDRFNMVHEEELKEERKSKIREYKQKPEVKAHQKAYQKAYYQKPEVKAYKKAHQKAYYQKPEVKAYKKAYQKAYKKAYYIKMKQKIKEKLI